MQWQIFNTASIFWLLAGVLAGIAATWAFGTVWQQRPRPLVFTSLGIAALVIVAVAIYSSLGKPNLLTSTATLAPHALGATSDNTAAANGAPQSMEAVTQQLAQRLARDGGTDSDWELLAQSYEFADRTEDAALARKHVVGVTATQRDITSPEATAALANAQTLRLQRNYAQARVAYEKAIALNGMTADSWADYADVLASSQQGQMKLVGAPAQAIDKALALNPNHAKALWLKASLAHEERRYADALVVWKRLRQVIGDSESDLRIVDANIAEAEQLAGGAATNALKSAVTGTIEIDPKLVAHVTPGSTLFIYAKSTDSAGPPLAVLRTTVSKWPLKFTLDDSMAMMPNRNLSSVSRVIVEARISRTGQATATAGDLQAAGAHVDVKGGKAVRLRIDKEVS